MCFNKFLVTLFTVAYIYAVDHIDNICLMSFLKISAVFLRGSETGVMRPFASYVITPVSSLINSVYLFVF